MKKPFEAVVADHGARVLRVCRVLVGPHDADDAWSETFLAALRAYPALPADANVEAWLVTIARRKAIDVLRSRARDPLPVERVPETASRHGIPGAGDPDLWAAVRRLPDKQRQAVAYRYAAGLPYAQIAAILGGTAAAARRAAWDGVANLRAVYPPAAGPQTRARETRRDPRAQEGPGIAEESGDADDPREARAPRQPPRAHGAAGTRTGGTRDERHDGR